MGKFQSEKITKPVAVITAFHGGIIRDGSGRKIADPVARLVHNRKANRELIADFANLGLGFYPVSGSPSRIHHKRQKRSPDMALLSWCKLMLLEQRLKFEFGKYNEYRRFCLDRQAKTAKEKLAIAKDVLNGPAVNTMTAQAKRNLYSSTGSRPAVATERPPSAGERTKDGPSRKNCIIEPRLSASPMRKDWGSARRNPVCRCFSQTN